MTLAATLLALALSAPQGATTTGQGGAPLDALTPNQAKGGQAKDQGKTAQSKADPAAKTPLIPGALVVDGKSVPVTYPDLPTPLDPAIWKWRGWGYLGGAAAKANDRYTAGYNWSQLKNAQVTPKATPLIWHLKVVVFAEIQEQVKGSYGHTMTVRNSFGDARLQQAKESLARFEAWVAAMSGGEVKVVSDVTVETETDRGAVLAPGFAQAYFAPRINGGGYEADDKVFRGPYQSVVYIVPAAPSDNLGAIDSVNGAPVQGIAAIPNGTAFHPDQLDTQLRSAWQKAIAFQLRKRGLSIASGPATADTWSEALSPADVPTATLLERLKTHATVPLDMERLAPSPIQTPATVNTKVSLASDADRGQILRVFEEGIGRNGGLALPLRADDKPLAKVSQTPTLSFWLKTSSLDPVGIAVISNDGPTAHISIGRGDVLGVNPAEKAIAFTGDGLWHHVAIDLKSAAPGIEDVTALAIEPTPGAIRSNRRGAGSLDADFDQFEFNSDPADPWLAPPTPNATSAITEDRALFAAKATATSPELIALLQDPVGMVRLNAAEAFTRIKDNEAQPNLIKCVVDIDSAVASTAMRALMYQGGEIALLTARRVAAIGVTPMVRAAAAELLAESKDPKTRGDLLVMLTDQSRLNRVAAVKAMAMLPGKEAALARLAFMEQNDPDIKVAVANAADPADDVQMRRLLWSAVNEPLDAVRAACDIKLLQSPDPATKAEGYKGVKDDGRWTRLIILDYLAKHPDEAHRNALRLAVADRAPIVRAAALRAFASLDKGATADEIANVMDDADPEVQLALQEFSKKRGFKLPDATRTLMSASPDDRVRKGVEGLP